MAYVNGSRLCVKYNIAEPIIHVRYVCGHFGGGSQRYMILTPDGDFYDEDYGDINDFSWNRARPANVSTIWCRRWSTA